MTEYSDRDAVIVGAVRTPVGKGKPGGSLYDVLPADLLAHSLRELTVRTGVDPAAANSQLAPGVPYSLHHVHYALNTASRCVAQRIEQVRAEGRAALVGYLPVGYPTVEGSVEAMRAMVAS